MNVVIAKPHHHFTISDYHRMGDAGVLPGTRIELIDGEILDMAPIGSRHAATVRKLISGFSRGAGRDVFVDAQNPIAISRHSEPQPDLALLRPRADYYAGGHPGPEDVLLLIEVCDSSSGYDRTLKLSLYARAGIPELWLVDLDAQRIEVHRAADTGRGIYTHVSRHATGELSPQALPDIRVDAAWILL